jgi:hypothetical protein
MTLGDCHFGIFQPRENTVLQNIEVLEPRSVGALNCHITTGDFNQEQA